MNGPLFAVAGAGAGAPGAAPAWDAVAVSSVSPAHEAFAALAEPLAAEPGVERGTNFSRRPGLRVGGRIFAMLVSETLVVKLPAERCAALVAEGAATPLATGGRPMREWVSMTGPPDLERWRALSGEALAFVRPA